MRFTKIRLGTLFFVLILFLVVPLALPERMQTSIVPIMFVVILLAGLGAVSDNRRHRVVAFALGLPALALTILRGIHAGPVTSVAASTLFIVFFFYVVSILVIHVVRARRADAEMLYGAAAVYLLLAILWAVGFDIVETLRPGSLTLGVDGDAIPGDNVFRALLYFSFVTISTLGYGDITPATEAARILAILEAVLGQLFLVLVVARLVGLYTADQYSQLQERRKAS
ncbi:MAG: two pore domain potassium channel family protein [Gemmatimonadota bacterium]|nr:MAG: two pore domain potassium channel family protein [Gemmatimonadota bacterium]